MRLATWNVNSLKARLPRVEEWLAEIQPDVLCLQETKLNDAAFPALAFEALGYQSVHHGQGQWNGVAILSRVGIDNVRNGFIDGLASGGPVDDYVQGVLNEARLITASCAGVEVTSVYVPNGRSVDDPHYGAKLVWLDRLREQLSTTSAPDRQVVVMGDFNIAPDDRDVYDPVAWAGQVLCTPQERAQFQALIDQGLVDSFRLFEQPPKPWTWWDYRNLAFRKNQGLRIDHILVSQALRPQVQACFIDKAPRKNERPSDHTPVVLDIH